MAFQCHVHFSHRTAVLSNLSPLFAARMARAVSPVEIFSLPSLVCLILSFCLRILVVGCCTVGNMGDVSPVANLLFAFSVLLQSRAAKIFIVEARWLLHRLCSSFSLSFVFRVVRWDDSATSVLEVEGKTGGRGLEESTSLNLMIGCGRVTSDFTWKSRGWSSTGWKKASRAITCNLRR